MSIINLRNHIADTCKDKNFIELKLNEFENKLKAVTETNEFVKRKELNDEIDNLIRDLKECFDDVLLMTPRNSSDIDILKVKINEIENLKNTVADLESRIAVLEEDKIPPPSVNKRIPKLSIKKV